MYFTRETLANNSRLRGHWSELWANRNLFNRQQDALLRANRSAMSPEMLAANNFGGFANEFWQELDNQLLESRDIETGMEIVTDLLSVQTILPIGKTARLYNMAGDIADDVAVSIDGQAPYSFDQTDYTSDGDPIPVFTAGYGVNWRLAAGLNSVGIDLVLDSQQAKERKFHKAIVKYMLDGNEKIQVGAYPGQGIRTHRNTSKVNLGSSAANINLTSATQSAVMAFFTTGAFAQNARANRVEAYDVLWVSPEIAANLDQDYIVDGQINGTIRERLVSRAKIREIRETYALSGNEFLGYQRRRDVISPLVGMAAGIVPLPRPMPQSNYNFQIMAAMGLQITNDDGGRSGVVYGADLD